MKVRFAVSMSIVAAGVCLSSLEAYAQGVTIKVVDWNVRDNSSEGGTAEEPDEKAAIVGQKPDVLFLQEVDRVAHLDSIVTALEADQPGTDWQQRNINRTNTTSGQSFLAILTRFAISNVRTTLLNAAGEVICGAAVPDARAAIGATITVNGQQFAVFSTRNTFLSGDCVAAEQNRRFKTWANTNYPNVTHLAGGDFNMIPTGPAYDVMTVNTPTWIDVWDEALGKSTATAADDSTPDFLTPTRNNRLDYLFYRNAGTALSVNSARITTRVTTAAPSSDGFASDHRMMTAIIAVGGAPPLPTDDFNDNTLHAQWSKGVWSGTTQDTTIAVNETNQRLEIGPLKANTTGSHFYGLRSSGSHDFTGASAYVQLVQPAAQTTGAFSMFAVGRNADNYYRWYVSGGRLVAEREIAAQKASLVDIGYVPASHQFLRICYDSSASPDTVVFQTAPNNNGAPGAWFTHHTETWNLSAVPVASVLFEMKAGTDAAEIAPGTVAYDNFRAARVANCQ